MANDLQTLANVLNVRDTDLNILPNTILDDAPLLQVMPAKSVAGYQNIYRRRTGAPTVGFRTPNAGKEHDKTDYTKITEDLSYLDFTSQMDVAVAESDIRGWEACVAEEAQSHLRAAMSVLEKQILNDTDSGSFTGFAALGTLDAAADEMVVDAGGATAGTSVYAIRFGPEDVQLTVGASGSMSLGGTYKQQVEAVGSADTFYQAYITPGHFWVGVQVANTRSVGRIASINSGAPLTDDLISDLLGKFPVSRWPSVLVMNRTAWQQLQDSRTATNVTGAPAPFPNQSFGVPIVVTDSLLDTEAVL